MSEEKSHEHRLQLPNDTNIRFCNAMFKLRVHTGNCPECFEYIAYGDGKLCRVGQEVIADEMAHTVTSPLAT